VAFGLGLTGGIVRLDVQGRTLAVHSAAGYGERGAGLTLTVGDQKREGLLLSMSPTWGDAASGTGTRWKEQVYRHHRSEQEQDAFAVDAQGDYGMRLPNGGLLTWLGSYSHSPYGRGFLVGSSIELADGLLPRPVRPVVRRGAPSFPTGRIQPGATSAASVTEEHSLRQQIARFAGVAPGFFPTPLRVPRLVRGCAVGPINPRHVRGGGCDPGCDQAVIGRTGLITRYRGGFPARSPAPCHPLVVSFRVSACLGDLLLRRVGMVGPPVSPDAVARAADGRTTGVVPLWVISSSFKAGFSALRRVRPRSPPRGSRPALRVCGTPPHRIVRARSWRAVPRGRRWCGSAKTLWKGLNLLLG